jgi:hypothetical protein
MITPHDPETDVALGEEVAWTRRTTGTAIVAVRVSTELLAKMGDYGAERGMTLSDVLRTGAERLMDESSSDQAAAPLRQPSV